MRAPCDLRVFNREHSHGGDVVHMVPGPSGSNSVVAFLACGLASWWMVRSLLRTPQAMRKYAHSLFGRTVPEMSVTGEQLFGILSTVIECGAAASLGMGQGISCRCCVLYILPSYVIRSSMVPVHRVFWKLTRPLTYPVARACSLSGHGLGDPADPLLVHTMIFAPL